MHGYYYNETQGNSDGTDENIHDPSINNNVA